MPKPTDVQSLLPLYQRGVLTAHEFVNRVIELAAETGPSEFVSQLPADLLASVHRRLDEAPTTEEDWSRTISIFGGTLPRNAEYDPEPERARSVYRAGIEALLAYFIGIRGRRDGRRRRRRRRRG